MLSHKEKVGCDAKQSRAQGRKRGCNRKQSLSKRLLNVCNRCKAELKCWGRLAQRKTSACEKLWGALQRLRSCFTQRVLGFQCAGRLKVENRSSMSALGRSLEASAWVWKRYSSAASLAWRAWRRKATSACPMVSLASEAC